MIVSLALGISACGSQAEKNVEFVAAWGTEGTADGQFQYVEDFDFDVEGNLLATDALKKDVQVFSRDGRFLDKFGPEETGEAALEKPEGIAVDSEVISLWPIIYPVISRSMTKTITMC
jgi:hypothetical protein